MSAIHPIDPAIAQPAPHTPASPRGLARVWRFLRTWPPMVIAGVLWIMVTLFVAVFADWLAPHGFMQLDLLARLAPPAFAGGSAEHWLGVCAADGI